MEIDPLDAALAAAIGYGNEAATLNNDGGKASGEDLNEDGGEEPGEEHPTHIDRKSVGCFLQHPTHIDRKSVV